MSLEKQEREAEGSAKRDSIKRKAPVTGAGFAKGRRGQ